MNHPHDPINQNFWYLKSPLSKQCVQNMHVDVAIVGGGIAGLSAAQACLPYNKKVAVFEKYFCGSGATGKGAGFITSNSELSLSDLEHQNNQGANNVWKFINQGIDHIRSNIINHKFECEYSPDGGLLVANCNRTLRNLQKEYQKVSQLGFQSQFFNKHEIASVLNTDIYYGGMTYENSFGINPQEYMRSLQRYLSSQNVEIFEETPVLTIDDHTITTPYATITADHIIVCVDRFAPDLNIYNDYIYHIQNFVLSSTPLSPSAIQSIFPTKKYMVWDSQLVYNYFRLTPDNRLILGGGDLLNLYASPNSYSSTRSYNKLTNYINTAFKGLDVQFECQWSGLIGISKDISPLAGPDEKYPHIYYIAASAGLPIATALGLYSAQHIFDQRRDLDAYFKPNRTYFVPTWLQKILGKKISFALSNFMNQTTMGCIK